MNKKLALALMSVPTVMGGALAPAMTRPAHANDIIAPQTGIVCAQTSRFDASQLVCRRVQTSAQAGAQSVAVASSQRTETLTSAASGAPEQPDLDFSYAESHAAIALFGCDCPACLNSLRTLRNMLPVVDDGRDPCWVVTNQGYRSDPDQVLQALNEAEANQTDFPLDDFTGYD
ncbi:MAG TPA: hypothetical protein V6D20_10400 [Candidatus Obscuribacterales bacterium]